MADSEYFADQRFKQAKIQEKLKDCQLGIHTWSSWFGTERGLAQECKICHKVRFHPEFDILAKEDASHDEILEGLHK